MLRRLWTRFLCLLGTELVKPKTMAEKRKWAFAYARYLPLPGLIGLVLGNYFGFVSNFGVAALFLLGIAQARITLQSLRDASFQAKHPFLYFMPLLIGLWCVQGSRPHSSTEAMPWLLCILRGLGGGLCTGFGLLFSYSLLFCVFREAFWQFVHSAPLADESVNPFSTLPDYSVPEPSENLPKFPVNY